MEYANDLLFLVPNGVEEHVRVRLRPVIRQHLERAGGGEGRGWGEKGRRGESCGERGRMGENVVENGGERGRMVETSRENFTTIQTCNLHIYKASTHRAGQSRGIVE